MQNIASASKKAENVKDTMNIYYFFTFMLLSSERNMVFGIKLKCEFQGNNKSGYTQLYIWEMGK